ncbi:type IV secretory system conjugative DNA transfer family protein [Neisseriaceae bacterium ESL0693]|nr:type IV secretory system conjugative DNA transfer family protein [Neisseriaceae bacterium ESL0693]
MKIKMNNAVGPQMRSAKPKSRKLLPILAFLSLVSGLIAATQYFAYTFDYHASLGSHIGHIYTPWSILQWASKWYSYYPSEIMKAGSIGVVVSAVGILGVIIIKVISSNTSKANQFLHGSARWAEKKDIQAAGLLPRSRTLLEVVTGKDEPIANGVYVGGWNDKDGSFYYLRHSGPEHVLCFAPTRSGKGVGLVVPTLLSWPASAIITDLKGELWALTAGWRKKYANNKVLRFEPASSDGGICWNPLDEIRLGTEFEVGDTQNLAQLIVDPDGKGLETHWQKTAFSLLVGVILHALYKAQADGICATLPSVDAMLADPNRDIGELWMEMVTYGHVDGQNHPAVGAAARDMMDRPDEEAGSVLSTAKSYLSLYRDPVVARNVSKSQFRIKSLMHEDDPVSLYIVTQPNDKARLRPLVRIMVNMIVRLLADKMDFENGRPIAHYKHRLLMMLDEFPSLGKLEILQESLAFVAGYGIKCYLICQDINQLKSRETGYGPDETITSNCHVQNAYPPNRIETAEHLSRLTGQTTIVKEQITTSGRRTAAVMGQVSRTFQEVQRPLLTPDECLRMPGPRKLATGEIEEAGDMVVYVAGYPAIYGKQPLYFKDPIFQARAEITAPKVSDKIIDDQDAIQQIAI